MIKHSQSGFLGSKLFDLTSVGRLSSRDSLVCVSFLSSMFLSVFLFSADFLSPLLLNLFNHTDRAQCYYNISD